VARGNLQGIRTGCDQGIDDASAVTFAVLSAPQASLLSDLGADLDGVQQSQQLIEHLPFPPISHSHLELRDTHCGQIEFAISVF